MLEPRLRQRRVALGDDLYSLFDSTDFLFRTVTPEILDARTIDALMDDHTRLIDYDDTLAGLWSFRSLEMHSWGVSQFSGFYELYYRLRSDLPITCWVQGYEAIIGYLTSRNDVVRVAFHVPEFDETGQQAAVAMGLTSVGTLLDTIGMGRMSHGTTVYSRVYEPDDIA